MKKVKITVLRRSVYPDLMEMYENPIEHACDMRIGDVFVARGGKIPKGFCGNAWQCIEKYVKPLAEGGGNFHDGWMKDPYSALVSCDDGFRPVSFLLEAVDE